MKTKIIVDLYDSFSRTRLNAAYRLSTRLSQ
jgi:hypothetical protein